MMIEQQVSELLDEIQNRPEELRVVQILEDLAWKTLDEATDAFEAQLADISRMVASKCRKNPGVSSAEQMHHAGELMGLARFIHCKRMREESLQKDPSNLKDVLIQILREMHEAGEGVRITLKASFDQKSAQALLNTYGIAFNFSTETRARLIARSANQSNESLTVTLRHRGGHIQGIHQIVMVLAPHLEMVETMSKETTATEF